MEEFLSVFEDMRSQIESLNDQVETLNLIVGPSFQIGTVVETLPAGGFGKVKLHSPAWKESDSQGQEGEWELKERPFTVKVFNPTDEDVDVDEQVNCGRNQWGVWIYVVGGGSSGEPPIVPVVLEKVDGEQGGGDSPATWIYDVYLAEKPTDGPLILEDADPVASPHHYARPNVGQIQPADFGLAWKIKKDPPPPEPEEGEDPEDPYEYELTWINETLYGAICEEEEEEEGGEGFIAPSSGGAMEVAQYSLATSAGTITNVASTLPFDTEDKGQSWSANSAGEITLQPGSYTVTASVTPDQTAGNNRIELSSVVQSNESGSFVDVPGTERRHYSRLTSHSGTSASMTFLLNVETAYAIRIQTRRFTGGSTVVCEWLGNGCSMIISRLGEAESVVD